MEGSRLKKKGRILKIRLGYNANSSSISTVVKVLILGASSAVIIINMISAAVFSRSADKRGIKDVKHE